MGFIRWLFARASFNRIDPIACLVVAVSGLPLWAVLSAILVWCVVSVLIERALFGADYHRVSNAGQHIAENLR